MKHIYMLHGMQATHQQDWCQWLEAEIQTRLQAQRNTEDTAASIHAKCIALPQPEQPDFQAWQHILSNELAQLNPQSIVIADDAACLALLHYLSQSRQMLHGLILIAPFTQAVPTRPELKDFIAAARLNVEQLRLQAEKRLLFFSSNDPLVPPPFSLKLAPLLNMQLIEVKNAGHFAHVQDPAAYAPLWQALSKLLQWA